MEVQVLSSAPFDFRVCLCIMLFNALMVVFDRIKTPQSGKKNMCASIAVLVGSKYCKVLQKKEYVRLYSSVGRAARS